MNKLKMIKAFAELEGVLGNLITFDNETYYSKFSDRQVEIYNPITDCAVAFKAMIKYGIEIEIIDGITIAHVGEFQADTMNGEPASKAIIECILKSKGLWQ